jgi:hypothetical protein
MIASSRPQPHATLRYILVPSAEGAHALMETVKDYELMMEILASVSAQDAGANLVALHTLAYDTIRSRTRLPSRLVTLGLRDFVARRAGEDVRGLPLDEKLYAIKGPSTLTVSTVMGRVVIPFDVAGYAEGWRGAVPARLVFEQGVFELRIGVTPSTVSTEEKTMIHEGILSRMGRLIAGIAYAAVDKAEGTNRTAVVEQAIREIDQAADEVRADLGKARAEEHRIISRRREIEDDVRALDEKIRLAIAEKRQDLAKAGAARQIDLEAQIGALEKALADVTERIDEGQKAMQAVVAARRDAEARLAELKRSEQRHAPDGGGAGGRRASPDAKVARASAAVTRATGVPGGAPPASAELDELERLHRERAINERLKRFQSDS